jgi:hypothetical protein
MQLVYRLALVAPLLFGLGAAGSLGVNQAWASILLSESSLEMGTWAASRIAPAESTWRSVEQQLLAAESHVDSDPANLELLGVLYSKRLGSPEYRDKSVVYLHRALAVRSLSPYTWANLAEVLYLRGETDNAFETALLRSAALGPSEPEVQRMIADYGLAVWAEVSPPTRGAISQMLSSGLRRNPLEMLQISERRGRLAFACRHLVGNSRAPDPMWYQLCQSTEATP